MKKFFNCALLFMAACALSLTVAACGDDKNDAVAGNNGNNGKTDNVTAETNFSEYSSETAAQWGNYMVVVANLLEADANKLYSCWMNDDNGTYSQSYAKIFMQHNDENYASAINCIEEIFDGCITIAGEVGSQKIGEPYRLYSTDKTAALYAVESWFSWHSREDYRNNIYSIRNAYYGSLTGSIDDHSLSKLLASANPDMDTKTKQLINDAAKAIMDIPEPFRNNITAPEVQTAMSACAALEEYLGEVKAYFNNNIKDEARLQPVINQYVNGVVLPTYQKLSQLNAQLAAAVKAFQQNPTNSAFTACANAWLNAREPWESSEAFLFGPVTDLGLDPNMDSWPLDQSQIEQILKNQAFKELEWTGNYEELDEENEAASSEQAKKIAQAQNLRGFHTLEFLVFKDGKARTVK